VASGLPDDSQVGATGIVASGATDDSLIVTGAGGVTLPAFLAQTTVPYGTLSAGSTNISWATFQTNDSGTFALNASPTLVDVKVSGFYQLWADCQFDTAPATLTGFFRLNPFPLSGGAIGGRAVDIEDATVGDPKEVEIVHGIDYCKVGAFVSLPDQIRLTAATANNVSLTAIKLIGIRIGPTF
jgi:hypothetical protein